MPEIKRSHEFKVVIQLKRFIELRFIVSSPKRDSNPRHNLSKQPSRPLNHDQLPVPPKIISNDVSADPVVREGDNLTLTCDARGHPKPHIVWRREDSEDIMVEGRKGWKMFLDWKSNHEIRIS